MRPPLFTVGDDTAQTPRGGGEAGGWAGGGRRVWEEQGGKERKDDAAAEEAAQCLQQQREGGRGPGSQITWKPILLQTRSYGESGPPLTRQYL